MNVLIVLGHVCSRSFNAALAETAVSELERHGHSVRTEDLYAAEFEPRLGRGDFPSERGDEWFDVAREQARAFRGGRIGRKLQEQVELLKWADAVILQFPIWWYGPPAILKGWMDRVFLPGFAYGRDRSFDTGGLGGKKAMLSITVDVPPTAYEPDGRYGEMRTILWPLHLSLRYVGFDVLEPFVAYEVSASEERRATIIAEFRRRLAGMPEEAPMIFRPNSDYDEQLRLKSSRP
jgi:NAD(P)H dehydrogenase (quinone)